MGIMPSHFWPPLIVLQWDEIVTSVANQPSLGPNVENSEERSSLDELSNERVQALS